MNNLCYRLIERTKQQMQALSTDGGTGTAGKRTSKLTVMPAVTNGESLRCCLIVAVGWAVLSCGRIDARRPYQPSSRPTIDVP